MFVSYTNPKNRMLPNRDTMKISRRISEVPMSGIRKMFDLAGPDSINLGLGEPDLAPPSEAIDGMNKAASAGLNKYGPTAGIPELRDAVAKRYSMYGDLKGSNIMITPSGSSALLEITQSMVDPGDDVLIPSPGFVIYGPHAQLAGGSYTEYRLTEGNFQPDIDDIQSKIKPNTKMIVVTTPSNPTGGVLDEQTYKALCDIAEPDIGVVTNVGSAHLEFFGTREAIAREKGELLRRAKTGFSLKENVFLPGEVEACPPRLEAALARVLPGAHNLANASLAYAVAKGFGVGEERAVEALESFALPGSRWRWTEKWGATFIDDSYNANPESMKAAIDAFAAMPCRGRRIAVLGDMFELGENAQELHREVFGHAMKQGFHLVIGVGEMSSKCICNLAYPEIGKLKRKFRVDVSAGDLVLLKASHSMNLGELLL